MFLALRSLIHETNDLEATKRWLTDVLGSEPYFDEDPYVGFDVGGDELGVLRVEGTPAPPRAYWGVDDLTAELARLEARGCQRLHDPHDVGGGITMVSVLTPHGFELGLIEHPAG
jgi:predicted enzyme related to lactoylglutathione lyase